MTQYTPSSSNGNRNMFAGLTLAGPLGASLAALALAAVLLFAGLSAIVVAALGRGPGEVRADETMNTLVAKHDEAMNEWTGRLNGRSPFFKPPAPQQPRQEPTRVEPKPEPLPIQSGPPPIDPIYRGPAVAFAYDDTVYFQPLSSNDVPKYLRIRAGEERSGIRVIETTLPWTVKVGYRGGEYVVPIFNKSEENTFLLSTPKPVILTPFLVSAPNPDAESPVAAIEPPADVSQLSAPTVATPGRRGPSAAARTAAPRAVPRARAAEEGGEALPDDVDVAPDEVDGDEVDDDDMADDVDADDADDIDDESPDPEAEQAEEPSSDEPAPGGETPQPESADNHESPDHGF